jgi:EF hand domain-containing protein
MFMVGGRHQAQCKICSDTQHEEIERDFINWHSPAGGQPCSKDRLYSSPWVVALFAAGATIGTAAGQKVATPKAEDKLALVEPEVKQLLLLMDTDKNGKISKQEWMKFMEAEFDRLDKDKSGDLDAKDLRESELRASHFTSVGK